MARGNRAVSSNSSAGVDVRSTRGSSRADRASASDPLNITIGIELEFLLAVSTYPEKATQDNLDDSLGRRLVEHALQQPMAAACATCGVQHTFNLQTVRSGSIDYANPHEYWAVGEDGSLHLAVDERRTLEEAVDFFHFYDIEIKSRILRPSKNFCSTSGARRRTMGHVHEISYLEEINAVLTRLHDFRGGPKRGNKLDKAYIIVNDGCGLHVHIGNERRGFPLPTVKKILSTYVANERAIDNLHAASRIGGSRLATMSLNKSRLETRSNRMCLLPMPYNSPWSMCFVAIAHALKRKRLGYEDRIGRYSSVSQYPETHIGEVEIVTAVVSFYNHDWIRVIEHAPSVRALQNLQAGFRAAPTLNLYNLGEYGSDGLILLEDDITIKHELMTLEFREHTGSLDFAEIRAWLDVVVSMVEHAHYTPDADFKTLSRKKWMQPEHSSIDLLQDLRCSEDTIRFYQQRLSLTEPSPHEAAFAADIAESDLWPIDAKIAPLMEYVAWKRRRDHLRSSVVGRIAAKLHMGGYGLFSDAYLDKLVDLKLDDPQFGS